MPAIPIYGKTFPLLHSRVLYREIARKTVHAELGLAKLTRANYVLELQGAARKERPRA
jgi:hypothetical protein